MDELLDDETLGAIGNAIHANTKYMYEPIKELLQTELTYIRELSILIDTFVDPLENWLKTFDFSGNNTNRQNSDYCIESIVIDEGKNIVDSLFANVKMILTFNRTLFQDLKEVATEGGMKVVHAFKRNAGYLKIYTNYITNFDRATLLLNRLITDPRFAAFISCAELQKQCHGLKLQAFLIMPVQRIPRYSLLFKEMLKKSKDPEEQIILDEVLTITTRVAQTINEAIISEEKRQRLLELQTAYGCELTDPAREFVREGNLIKLCHTGKKVFHFVLCSDKIFYGEEISTSSFMRQKRYRMNRSYYLTDIQLILYSGESKSFILRAPDKAFEITTSTLELCQAWIDDIMKYKAAKRITSVSAFPKFSKDQQFKMWALDGKNVVERVLSFGPNVDATAGVVFYDDLTVVSSARDSTNPLNGVPDTPSSDARSEVDPIAAKIASMEAQTPTMRRSMSVGSNLTSTESAGSSTVHTSAKRHSMPDPFGNTLLIPTKSFHELYPAVQEQESKEADPFAQIDTWPDPFAPPAQAPPPPPLPSTQHRDPTPVCLEEDPLAPPRPMRASSIDMSFLDSLASGFTSSTTPKPIDSPVITNTDLLYQELDELFTNLNTPKASQKPTQKFTFPASTPSPKAAVAPRNSTDGRSSYVLSYRNMKQKVSKPDDPKKKSKPMPI